MSLFLPMQAWPPLIKRPGWNPNDKGSNVTLSNNNQTMACSSGTFCRVRSTTAHSTGKYYVEFVADSVTTGTNTPMVGLLVGTATLNAPIWGFGGDDGYGTLPAPTMFVRSPSLSTDASTGFSATDNFGMAVDFGAGKIWFAHNNTWVLSGNPSTGANPNYTGLAGTYFLAAYANGGQVTAHFASPTWTYAAPTGFGAW